MYRSSLDVSDTLFALGSGSLPSAVALVRLSGPRSFELASKLFRPVSGGSLNRERGMHYGELIDASGQPIDSILLLSFVGPHSFTGEDVIEFHIHGSLAIYERLQTCLLQSGARAAKRGEFSYRAFLNGKLSASELESLGDVFLARDAADLDGIYRRKDGSVERAIEKLRADLIGAQAILDTAIDFSDEYSSVLEMAKRPIESVIRGCSELIHRYSVFRQGGRVGRIVLAGRPNAGKSSLFNALLCRYRAIVHSDPGTTRDVIEEDIQLVGRRWKLVDTAGIRETSGVAEKEGISLGEEFLASSSFWILVVDGASGLAPEEAQLLVRYHSIPHLVVWNKSDLPSLKPVPDSLSAETVRVVSAQSAAGIPDLWKAIEEKIVSTAGSEEAPLPSAVQTARLTEVLSSLQGLSQKLGEGVPPEYLAEENRRILASLSEVVGVVDTEMVLDRIFGEFCIGK